MSSAFHDGEQEEPVPFDVEDEVDVGDLSDQQGGVLDPAPRVHFSIKKASVRTQREDMKDSSSPWTVKRLSVEAQVGAEGIDGEGKYANKVLFPEFVLTFNSSDFPEKFKSDWWQREARYPTKQFLKALGEDITSIRINDDFLVGLQTREFIADIKRVEIKQKNSEGKYIATGDYKNELTNYRAAS